jgi:hypothetical protein
MPTKKPRIQVSVKPSQYALLQRLAKLQGRSMASVIGELFDQMEPVYERVAVVMQAAVRAQASMKQGLRDATEQAEAEIAPHLAQAMGQLDLLVTQSDAWNGGIGGGRAATAHGPSPTPEPVTRGSGIPTRRPVAVRSRHGLSKSSSRKSRAKQGILASPAKPGRRRIA